MNKYFLMLCEALPDVSNELIAEMFNERAAIREYEGNYPREMAEELAYNDVLSMF